MENKVILLDFEKELITANGRLNLSVKAEVKPGSITVLFGESGAGKTTILRILAGLTQPDKGLISIGNNVLFDSQKGINIIPQQRNIGLMFQDYALFPNMTVSQNIQYAQTNKDPEQVKTLLETFGLTEFANRKPTKLSGGQKQRVALARAIARKPELLLLDEPLSAIDTKMRASLQDEILKIQKTFNTTILLVSHDLAEVFRLANHVLRIENAKITATGSPEEIFLNRGVSGKVQVTGIIVKIEPNDTFYLITVITGLNQIVKVVAFADDIKDLTEGEHVMIFTKAFNPLIMKINN